MKTANEVIARAHRQIRVLGGDDPLTAEMRLIGFEVLTSILAELVSPIGATFTWDVETVPDNAFLPLSGILASDLAEEYNKPARPREVFIRRFLAVTNLNDVEDRRDLDEDGAISTAEESAGERAAFY